MEGLISYQPAVTYKFLKRNLPEKLKTDIKGWLKENGYDVIVFSFNSVQSASLLEMSGWTWEDRNEYIRLTIYYG